MYVQLGGSAYIGGLEITVQGDTVVAVDQLIITQDMIAGLEPNAEVAAILAAEGKRLAMLAEAAVIGLEKQGADFIVALTNMGYERAGFSAADLDWAAEYLSGHVDLIIDGMGSIPYQEIRGTTMYVQLGGSAYVGGLEVTVQDGAIIAVEQLLITQDMAAGLEPNAEVAAILAAEGKRLAGLLK